MVKKIGRKHAEHILKRVLVPHRGGSLPLHMACRSNASAAVVKMLLDRYPKATEVQNFDGDLPLHLACRFGSCPEVVRMIIDANPKSVDVRNNEGKKPLDLLLEYTTTTTESTTLLHQVCQSGVPYEILRVLGDSYPEGCLKEPKVTRFTNSPDKI